MFVLRTGLQGNGKTLNSIKEIDLKAHSENRTVYYCNITGFNPDHPVLKASWVPFDTPEKWFELPKNAIIVIDEAQTYFRTRPQGSRVPEYASRLEIMRKDGHELHAITQSPKLIDAHMRELCNGHIHYVRAYGGKVIKRWYFQKPQLDVNSNKLDFQNGESSRIVIDKNYFGCYESVKDGTGHHFKFKPPKVLILFIVIFLVCSVLSYKLYRVMYEKINPDTELSLEKVDAVPSSSFSSSPVSGPQVLTTEQYLDARIPRVKDVPSSAPIYDALTTPVTYPKPFCVSSSNLDFVERNSKRMALGMVGGRITGCRCNSQQGTRLDISFDSCIAYVDYGYFDPAKPDRQPVGAIGASEARAATIATTQPASVSVSSNHRVTVVKDTSRLEKPFSN